MTDEEFFAKLTGKLTDLKCWRDHETLGRLADAVPGIVEGSPGLRGYWRALTVERQRILALEAAIDMASCYVSLDEPYYG